MTRFFKYSAQSNAALAQNPKHKFAAQHALNIYKKNAIYSFIPKNACSTMRTSVAYANGCIEDPADFNWIHRNNNTFAANLRELITAEYTFTVLRCPFSRLASSYLDKIVSRNTVAWGYVDARERKVEIEDITFESFVKSMTMPRIKAHNIHWRPQIEFLAYKEYDDYFAIENFSHAVKTLQEKIGLEIIDARKLTNHGVDRYALVHNEDFSAAKPFEFLRMKQEGSFPAPKALYNDELVNIVKQSYKEDFALYNDVIGSDGLMF